MHTMSTWFWHKNRVWHPFIWSKRSSIYGRGYLFLFVTSFKEWQSTHICCVLSFFSMNNMGAPQGDKLGQMNPFDCSSAICFFSSASSFTGILYSLLEIGGVPGNSSIINSMSRSGGIYDNSSGNTSGYSLTTLISSKEVPCTRLSRLASFSCMATLNTTTVPSSVVSLIALLAHIMTLSYFIHQSMPRMMSMPL
jgi:hypothetical protein